MARRNYLDESQAAEIRHTVITIEKTIGTTKKYLQLKTATAAQPMASAQAMPRTCAKVSAGRLPSCQAITDASRRNTVTKSPNPTKKSQYVRVKPCTSKWMDLIEVRSASTPHCGSDWRNPTVCPTAKSSRQTAATR